MSEVGKDCLGCKITGTVTALGISVYCLYERNKIPLPETIFENKNNIIHYSSVSNKDWLKSIFSPVKEFTKREARIQRNLLGVLSFGFFSIGLGRFFWTPNSERN
ncbi:hypothetical protein HK099_000245 [Clydaea vesicula]|uniref:DUF4536 domain-containing protein n=1 Tax=Clydaea vesicula TaxID=447962 RepID=A0AAD5TUV3_9FUNG|nr:hypothetical protein HK099_000245 [Clydaea vesicula]